MKMESSWTVEVFFRGTGFRAVYGLRFSGRRNVLRATQWLGKDSQKIKRSMQWRLWGKVKVQ